MADDLRELERWFSRILAGMEPGPRRAAAFKLGQALRRANLLRISSNIEPDGGAMRPRKASVDERGRVRKKAGARMFRRLRVAKSWRLTVDADGVEITPASAAIDRVAAVHQFGEIDRVGRLRNGRTIRVKYPARRLLGFSDEDRATALEFTSELLDSDSR